MMKKFINGIYFSIKMEKMNRYKIIVYQQKVEVDHLLINNGVKVQLLLQKQGNELIYANHLKW
ncbi:unnamed protein product [Paramecium sonneborni]|uniref:Uncharacterized protein n=1 Tax=Paramecium sonneborni TaxID=65129 RepID=A0A8S1R9B2_9CILI|nr:unnamed protein product [Paramecium sonneborni]